MRSSERQMQMEKIETQVCLRDRPSHPEVNLMFISWKRICLPFWKRLEDLDDSETPVYYK